MSSSGLRELTGNAYDYVKWRSDLSLEADPINEVDIFLLSQFATPDFGGIVSGNVFEITLEEACDKYFLTHSTDKSNIGLLQSDYLLPTLRIASKSNRYRGLGLCGYVNRVREETAEQFSAVITCVNHDLIVVTFMGTDDTLTGWKEDFHLGVMERVPSQKDAAEYLAWAAEVYPTARIAVCGHSKGGNLALYSAVTASEEIRDRIEFVYNLDGPGLRKEFLDSEGYRSIRGKLRTIVSEQTTIGTLMNMNVPLTIVQTDAVGMVAHDAFTWKIVGNKFIKTEKLSKDSILFGYTINKLMESLPDEELVAASDALFEILFSTGARTLTEMKNTDVRKMLHALSQMKKQKEISRFAALLKKETEKTIKLMKKGDITLWENTD